MTVIRKRSPFHAAGAAAVLAAVVAGASASAQNDPGAIMIIGDTPYSAEDAAMLEKALPLIAAGDYPFVIHLGDYKGGRAPCVDAHDAAFAALIERLAPTPVFYTPGDNEWTDCDRNKNKQTGALYSDLARLETVRRLFAMGTPAGGEVFRHRRQARQPENASWTHEGVRYLTLHVTGTNNGRDWVTGDAFDAALSAVTERDAANAAWLAEGFATAKAETARAVVVALHGDVTDVRGKPTGVMCEDVAASDKHPCDAFVDFRRALRDAAAAFDGPVLIIHGDTAPFTFNQDFAGDEAPNLWRLNAAGDAGTSRFGVSYGVCDVTVLEFQFTEETPFRAYGLLTGKTPKKR